MEMGVISEAIKLATAPVFLLTGVGGILNVLGNRLARVIDRARRVQSLIEDASRHQGSMNGRVTTYLKELESLKRRKFIINVATAFLVLCAVLIALTVIELFFQSASSPASFTSLTGCPSPSLAAFCLWWAPAFCISLKFCTPPTPSALSPFITLSSDALRGVGQT
jgi:Protein of unknown function (DUF2721)